MKKEKGKRITKRAEFLEKMDAIIPWAMWIELIRPYYPDGQRGRPVKGIERMLRMYLLQTWFDLSDERAEDELSDSISMRKFARMEEGEEAPDATTLLKFRHLLEKHELNRVIFEALNGILEETGHMLRGGTIGGRDDHSGSVLHEKSGEKAGRGDAFDQKEQQFLLWHEGAYRRGRFQRAGSHPQSDAGERIGCGNGRRIAPGGRQSHVGR